MSPAEHGILGFFLISTAVAFFGIAVPGYWMVRKVWPESSWNLGGSVGTAFFRNYDLVIVGLLVLFYGFQWKGASGVSSDPMTITTSTAIASGLFYLTLGMMVVCLLARRTHLAEFFGLRWEGWRWIFVIVPMFLIGIFLSAALIQMSGWHERVVQGFGSEQQKSVQLLMNSSEIPLLIALTISAVIIAPLAEELIFRGYIYPVAKRYSEKWFAAIFSAALFGVVHLNLLGLPMLILIGFVLVVLYEKTGSIWPCIFCHMAFNGFSIGMIFLARFLKLPLSS